MAFRSFYFPNLFISQNKFIPITLYVGKCEGQILYRSNLMKELRNSLASFYILLIHFQLSGAVRVLREEGGGILFNQGQTNLLFSADI